MLQTERLNLVKENKLREQEKAQSLTENNELLKREAEKVNALVQDRDEHGSEPDCAVFLLEPDYSHCSLVLIGLDPD